MKLREHLQITVRSIKLLYSLSRRYFISMTAESVGRAVLPYVPIYFSARLIDALAAGEPVEVLALYVALTVGLTALLGLLNAWLAAQAAIGSQENYNASEWLYAEKAMGMSYASIEDREVTLLRERIKMESQTGYNLWFLVSTIQEGVGNLVQVAASISLCASFFAISAVSLGAKLAFVAGVILTVAVSSLLTRKDALIRNQFYAEAVGWNTLDMKFSQYLENYGSGKDIRLYAMEEPLVEFNKSTILSIWKKEAKMDFLRAGLRFLDTVLNHGLRLGVYLLLISAALSGGLSVGSIARYASCVVLLLSAAAGLVYNIQMSLVNDQYMKRFFSYLDIPNPMYQGSLTIDKRDDCDYDVEFRDVSFRYPNTEAYALRHVNLRFRVGEKLAAVGMNGSGKTTFIKLLCRLYDPTEGTILLNGIDIRKYSYPEYLSIFSVVFQDFALTALPLGQNVASAVSYDRESAISCLKKAGFGDRLDGLPGGLDTYLGKDLDEKGVDMSGGEKQKIALARALYKNAAFIVLDEPTAALDPIAEAEIYSRFNTIIEGKTAIYISHRLSSCKFCDDILVFDKGSVIQQGSHDVLVADAAGKYHELWHAQAQYYDDARPGGALV